MSSKQLLRAPCPVHLYQTEQASSERSRMADEVGSTAPGRSRLQSAACSVHRALRSVALGRRYSCRYRVLSYALYLRPDHRRALTPRVVPSVRNKRVDKIWEECLKTEEGWPCLDGRKHAEESGLDAKAMVR